MIEKVLAILIGAGVGMLFAYLTRSIVDYLDKGNKE